MKPEETVRYLEHVKNLELIKKHEKLFEEKRQRTPLVVYAVAIVLISVFAFLTYIAWQSKSDWGFIFAGGGLIASIIGLMKVMAGSEEGETVWVSDDDDDESLIDPVDPTSPLARTKD